jgi:hypothetical protein
VRGVNPRLGLQTIAQVALVKGECAVGYQEGQTGA